MKPKPALIIWRDAWRNSDKEALPECLVEYASKVCMRYDTGYVLEKSQEFVIFADGMIEYTDGSEPTYFGVHHVPTGMVKKIKYLK